MPASLKLSKEDIKRAFVRHQFAPCTTQKEVFDRLHSIQFDPIAPVGCNHDLVLQARLADYKIGDWQKIAYEERLVYDGWDKQASLVPFEGWPVRRIFYRVYLERSGKVLKEHPEAVSTILREIEARGPLLPRECEFQERREEFKGSWYGPSLTKQVLRALWHAGQVMTAGRRSGHHVYDLTERVVPPRLYNQPELTDDDAYRELFLDRHQALGILRPTASYEVWSYAYAPTRKKAIDALVDRGNIVPIEIEGIAAHATPEFLSLLDEPPLEPRVVFVAPLDQLLWDRKLINHLFGVDYIWEIYTPEAKRKWGYYVLPVLFGNDLVAKVEFWSRAGVLEIRNWHWEANEPAHEFFPALELALRQFMRYCSAKKVTVARGIDKRIRDVAKSAAKLA